MKKIGGIILLIIGIILTVCWIYVGFAEGVINIDYSMDAIYEKIEFILTMIVPMAFLACGWALFIDE